MEEPYVYVHVFINSTDASAFNREVIPASVIRKFDYAAYKKSKKTFKNKCFKFQRSEGGEKMKCCILYAAGSFHEVNEYIKTALEKNKRWPIPNLKATTDVTGIDDTTVVDVDEDIQNEEANSDEANMEEANFEAAKSKSMKADSRYNKRNQAQKLVDKYIATRHDLDENQIPASNNDYLDMNDDIMNLPPSSTPLNISKINSIGNIQAGVRGYQEQLHYFKKEAEKWTSLYETAQKNQLNKSATSSDRNVQETESFKHYDKVFNYKWTAENQAQINFSETEDTVTLRRGVICNSLAYKNAYKVSNPSEFITILSVGIYGKENFSTRCVRLQKNTTGQLKLDTVKTEVIEEEFYNFLRVKRFTLEQIELQLAKLNRLHHNAISTTRKRIEREKAEEARVEAQLNILRNQQRQGQQILQRCNNELPGVPDLEEQQQVLQPNNDKQREMDSL